MLKIATTLFPTAALSDPSDRLGGKSSCISPFWRRTLMLYLTNLQALFWLLLDFKHKIYYPRKATKLLKWKIILICCYMNLFSKVRWGGLTDGISALSDSKVLSNFASSVVEPLSLCLLVDSPLFLTINLYIHEIIHQAYHTESIDTFWLLTQSHTASLFKQRSLKKVICIMIMAEKHIFDKILLKDTRTWIWFRRHWSESLAVRR